MYRWLWIGSLTALLLGSTGCLHHNVRSGCGSCASGSCNSCGVESCGGGDCGDCQSCGSVGLLGKMKSRAQIRRACSGQCGSGVLGCLCSKTGMCNSCLCGNNDCGGCGGACGNSNCGGGCGMCAGARAGCVAGPLGWQQGGLDYSSHLQPGLLGHNAASALNNRPFTPGPPTGQVAYPYYSVRGPRDFFVDNPPTIGR